MKLTSQDHSSTTTSFNSLKILDKQSIKNQNELLGFVILMSNNTSTSPTEKRQIANLITLKLMVYLLPAIICPENQKAHTFIIYVILKKI